MSDDPHQLTQLLARTPEVVVRGLVAMRDDFLFHCQRFEALQPVFAELTPLGAPTGAASRSTAR